LRDSLFCRDRQRKQLGDSPWSNHGWKPKKGLNAGTPFFLRLQNSKIDIDLPFIGTFADDKPIGGIEPDVWVTSSVENIIEEEDEVLITTRRIIQENSDR